MRRKKHFKKRKRFITNLRKKTLLLSNAKKMCVIQKKVINSLPTHLQKFKDKILVWNPKK